MARLNDPLVFTLPGYEAMGQEIAGKLGAEMGAIERKAFPDGERYHRLLTPVAHRDVLLVGGTIDDQHTLDLFDLGCAISKYGALRLDLVIPYFGYSTMERAVKDHEVVTAKTRARLLSAIPRSANGNRAWFVDLHTEGIPHYVEDPLAAHHIYAEPVLVEQFKAFGGDNMVLASTDAGRAKWVQSLAMACGCEAAIIIKRRLSGSETTVAAVSCDVTGKHVVIYDDMIRTGGSLLGAARTYREAGAADVDVVATHGVLPGNALDRILGDGTISRVACSDSHPNACALVNRGLHLINLGSTIAARIQNGGP